MEAKPASSFLDSLLQKKYLIAGIVGALVIVVIAAISVVMLLSGDSKKTANQDNNNIASNVLSVGDFRYVNACNAFTADDQAKYFAELNPNAATTTRYAESLEGADTSSGVESECQRRFGENTKYANMTLRFIVQNYATTEEAKRLYDVAQNQDGATFGGASVAASDRKPLPGVSDTLFSEDNKQSMTLVGNKHLIFSAAYFDSSGLTIDQLKESIVAALPSAVANAKNDKLSQSPVVPAKVKIGEVAYQSTCAIFTAKDFQALSGTSSDPTNINAVFTNSPATTAPSDVTEGYASASCNRVTSPDGDNRGGIKASLTFYTTVQEASVALPAIAKRVNTSTGNAAAASVDGIGDASLFVSDEASGRTGKTGFFVQKGSYVIAVESDGFGRDRTPLSLDAYKKATAEILKRLR